MQYEWSTETSVQTIVQFKEYCYVSQLSKNSMPTATIFCENIELLFT